MLARECFDHFRIIDPEELVPIGEKLGVEWRRVSLRVLVEVWR